MVVSNPKPNCRQICLDFVVSFVVYWFLADLFFPLVYLLHFLLFCFSFDNLFALYNYDIPWYIRKSVDV